MIRLVYIFIDIGFIYLSIFIACELRPYTLPFEPVFQDFIFYQNNPYRFIFVFWIVTTILFLNSKALYQTHREVPEVFEITVLAKTTALSSFIVIIAIYVLKIPDFPRSVLLIGTIFNIIFFSSWRILKRLFVQCLVVRGYNNFNALIIGAGRVGSALAKEIQETPALGIKVVGFLDDFKLEKNHQSNIKILGKICDFPMIAKKEFINKIFITIHHNGVDFLRLLEEAKEQGVAVRVVPPGFNLVTSEFSKYNIGFIPILEYSNETLLRKQVGKRLFDCVTGLIGFIVLLPLFVALGILIKLDTPGPVFYFSRRYGRNGRIFHMLKFRTMQRNADKLIKQMKEQNEVDGPIFKVRKDPRVTKMGRFLRKYSLDELPQLINVMKGDMSLVGPRPFPIEQIEKEDLKQLKRLEVRPGITGLWQIRGRSDISFNRLIRWDMWYINNWSFWLDLNILFQTFPVVVKGKGAY